MKKFLFAFILTSISTQATVKEKVMTYASRQVSISISRSPEEVYKFTSNPENFPKWAAGLSRAEMKKSGNEWIADSPMGKVKVKFAKENQMGVMDHDVTLPSGETNHNPFRVVKNGEGSDVIFTVYRRPKVSEADFAKDAKQVEADLHKLKSILENSN